MLDKNRIVKPLNFSVVPQEKKKKKKEMVILKLKIPFWQCLICKLFIIPHVKIYVLLSRYTILPCFACCWKHQQSCDFV